MFKIIILLIIQLLIISGCDTITGVKAISEKYKDHIDDVKIKDRTIGDGKEAVNRSRLSVHYTGWLYDSLAKDKKGKKFDSSYDRGQPFEFTLGMGEVIAGWDKGVKGMKEGGQRSLVIPASMAYGRRGSGRSIPGGAILFFDIELIEVK